MAENNVVFMYHIQGYMNMLVYNLWCVARFVIPFVQLKEREKHPYRSVSFSNFTKSSTPPWVYFTFFKLCKWYQIAQSIMYEYLEWWIFPKKQLHLVITRQLHHLKLVVATHLLNRDLNYLGNVNSKKI